MRRCRAHKGGSAKTKADRKSSLFKIATDLHGLGYRLNSAKSLKPKHVDALVEHWTAQGLSAGTMKNRMVHMRWWASEVNKASVVAKSNTHYGIEHRSAYNGDRAQPLDHSKLESIPCPNVRLSVKLQSAFGLRREESILFIATYSDRGDHIRLKANWCKGKRARTVPVVNEEQRELLNEVKTHAQGRALIPDEKSLKDQIHTYEHQTLAAGFNNLHGLRHDYAQKRYQALTGMPCRAQGGLFVRQMDEMSRERDYEARMIISQELGHNRVSVTNAYLGPRR